MAFRSNLEDQARVAIGTAQQCNSNKLESNFTIPVLSRACGMLGLRVSANRKAQLVERLLSYFGCPQAAPARVPGFDEVQPVRVQNVHQQRQEQPSCQEQCQNMANQTRLLTAPGAACLYGYLSGCDPVMTAAGACLGCAAGACLAKGYEYCGREIDKAQRAQNRRDHQD